MVGVGVVTDAQRGPTPAGEVDTGPVETFVPVQDAYADFARYAAGESPCLEAWARAVAADPEIQGWIATLPLIKQQPNLVFAAARWHDVPAPGPYGALRDALLGDDAAGGAIRATIMARSTQTNEVGRLATLAPVLGLIQQSSGRPLALVEAGASAGLCLFPDRWRYRWHHEGGTESRPGPAGGVLDCAVTGNPPLPTSAVEVAWRAGIDLNPLDVRDPDAMAWLAGLVWPEQDGRRTRLAQAIGIARDDPPYLVRGDLLEELPDLVHEAAGHGHPVVFHSAVAAYLEPEDRGRFHALMSRLVADGACSWISNEGPQVLPGITATGPVLPAGSALFVLGLDGRAVAWTHGHGRSLTWLSPDLAGRVLHRQG